jgi:hypothetical protein
VVHDLRAAKVVRPADSAARIVRVANAADRVPAPPVHSRARAHRANAAKGSNAVKVAVLLAVTAETVVRVMAANGARVPEVRRLSGVRRRRRSRSTSR